MFGFDNIGKKIRIVAKIFFILQCIGSFICAVLAVYFLGIYATLQGIKLPFYVGGIAGVFILFFGMLFAWLSNLCLYGFGQLISNTSEIKELTTEINDTLLAAAASSEPEPKPSVSVDDVLKRIQKLQRYLRDGQITQEQYVKEYNRLKQLLQ